MGNNVPKKATSISFIIDIIKPFDIFIFSNDDKKETIKYGIAITSDIIPTVDKELSLVIANKIDDDSFELVLKNLKTFVNDYSKQPNNKIEYYHLKENPLNKDLKESEIQWNNRTNALKKIIFNLYCKNMKISSLCECLCINKKSTEQSVDNFIVEVYKNILNNTDINLNLILKSAIMSQPIPIN